MKKTVENCKIMLLSNIGDGKIECLKKLKNNPRRLAYIPSRSDFGQSYFQRVIDTYSEIVEEFIYCDLESNDYDGLFSADVIFIAGGDECFILKNLLSKGLASKIVDFLNEGNVLIGLCAGAQVISKDIIFVEPSKREKKLEALGYGLGIIDKVINIASLKGQLGSEGQSNYAASKAGVIGYSRSLAKELGKLGVSINVICPGYIKTDLNCNDTKKNIIANQMSVMSVDHSLEDYKNFTLFLASDFISGVSGQVFNIDSRIM